MPFRKQILKLIKSSPISTFNVHNPYGFRLRTRLRFEINNLRKHKFRRDFQDSLDQFCKCGRHIETTINFFLHSSNYSNQRKTLSNKISKIKPSMNQNDSTIVETFLFGSDGLSGKKNALIIESTIE